MPRFSVDESGRLVVDIGKGQRVMVPRSLREGVIRDAHEGALGGHYEMQRTLRHIRRSFHWVGLFADVRNYCLRCVPCQATRVRYSRPPGKWPAPSAPWHELWMDTTTVMGSKEEGAEFFAGGHHAYLQVFLDPFTGYIAATPKKTTSAIEAARALERVWFANFPTAPAVVRCDGGPENKAELMEVVRKWGANLYRHAPDNHRGAGLIERAIRDVTDRMVRILVQKPGSWEDAMGPAVAAHNAACNPQRGMPPFEALFGIPPVTPMERKAGLPSYVRDIDKRVHNNLLSSSVGQTPPKVGWIPLVGDMVWMERSHPATKFDAKLKRTGPYLVVSVDVDLKRATVRDVASTDIVAQQKMEIASWFRLTKYIHEEDKDQVPTAVLDTKMRKRRIAAGHAEKKKEQERERIVRKAQKENERESRLREKRRVQEETRKRKDEERIVKENEKKKKLEAERLEKKKEKEKSEVERMEKEKKKKESEGERMKKEREKREKLEAGRMEEETRHKKEQGGTGTTGKRREERRMKGGKSVKVKTNLEARRGGEADEGVVSEHRLHVGKVRDEPTGDEHNVLVDSTKGPEPSVLKQHTAIQRPLARADTVV